MSVNANADMKGQSNHHIRAHVQGAVCLLLLLVLCRIPVALAQTNAGQQGMAKPAFPNSPRTGHSQLPTVFSRPTRVRALPILPWWKFPAGVLYDQLNSPGTNSTISQEFPDIPGFTNLAADDFLVPADQTWNITEVDVQGDYFTGSGPADNFNVSFYQDSGGLPGMEIYTATGQSYVNNAGVFEITLANPAVLTAGTYWVSVQAHMSLTTAEWAWTNRTMQVNNKAAWENPGGHWFPPPSCVPGCPMPCPMCITWGVRECCTGSPAGEPDQMFRLIGTSGGSTPTPTPTASATPTSTATSTPTATATSTITPTPTGTPTSTPTPTSTVTATATPSGTPTATPTPTGMPSATPRVSPTPRFRPAPRQRPTPPPHLTPVPPPPSPHATPAPRPTPPPHLTPVPPPPSPRPTPPPRP